MFSFICVNTIYSKILPTLADKTEPVQKSFDSSQCDKVDADEKWAYGSNPGTLPYAKGINRITNDIEIFFKIQIN